MIHLDTSIVIAYLRGDAEMARRLERSVPDVALSSVVLAELWFGAHRSARPQENTIKIQSFIQFALPVPFDEGSAQKYGELKAHLASIGKPCGEVDALIAAALISYSIRLTWSMYQTIGVALGALLVVASLAVKFRDIRTAFGGRSAKFGINSAREASLKFIILGHEFFFFS